MFFWGKADRDCGAVVKQRHNQLSRDLSRADNWWTLLVACESSQVA